MPSLMGPLVAKNITCVRLRMSIMRIGLQMQAVVGYMACGTAFFDTFFLDATIAGISAKTSAIDFAATAGM